MICKAILTTLCSIALMMTFSPTSMGENISELRPDIVESAKKNDIDPTLLEAILRHESANGKSRAARIDNNLGGVMKNRKLRKFQSQQESVEYVAKIIAKYKTYGLVSIEQIGRRYAPHNREWPRCVRFFKQRIESGVI